MAAPLEQTLTYATAPGEPPRLGQRLLVPLGGRLVTGYLVGFTEEVPAAGIKPIRETLDEKPLFPEKMIPFFRWVARYYHHPIGEVIRSALPAGLVSRSGREIILSEEGKRYFATTGAGQTEQHPWLARLLAENRLGPATVRPLWQGKERRRIERWQSDGLLAVRQVIHGERVGHKVEPCLTVAAPLAPEATAGLTPSERKTLALLLELGAADHPVARREATSRYSGAGKAIRALADKGVLHQTERRVYRDPFGETPPFFPKPEALSCDQQEVLDRVVPAIQAKKYAPFLLHGVTGSGKTEVYLRASEAVLAIGRSVLVLVPEIALATQLEGHFLSRFGEKVALLHSGLTSGERFDQYHRVLSGEATVVIGARSAVFAPLSDPGLIIVDEEHDPAYKQEDGLRYQGRDLALLRGSQCQATVLLGSATPSVASFQHAQNGKYTLLAMPSRIEARPMPAVEVVDLRAVNTVSGRPPLFSPQLTRAMRETLARGEQSLIFLNRRGFASAMLCGDCGQPVQCPHCQVSLTLHRGRGQLLCHYCGHSLPGKTVCGNCRSMNLIGIGFGTERIEDELHRLFPEARVARLDRDTGADRKQFIAILRAVREREVDILVGTQMIAKGHHFPHVTLVGIVWADAGLGIPDYKAGERTFQLLSQVTGRAGRGELPGRVIVQTSQPDHYSVSAAQAHDYDAMFAREISLRRELAYPPFTRLINLQMEGEAEATVRERAMALAARGKAMLGQFPGTSLLGPAPSPLMRLRGQYRWQLLLRGTNHEPLHSLCDALAHEHASLGGPVKLVVDVDPESML
ncbi:MAG: replication restart helicase PriA [Thermodesulfobacteriota bacterium]